MGGTVPTTEKEYREKGTFRAVGTYRVKGAFSFVGTYQSVGNRRPRLGTFYVVFTPSRRKQVYHENFGWEFLPKSSILTKITIENLNKSTL